MFGLGMSEIIFLGLLALIVIGPKELPELARTIGRFMNELKRSTNILTDDLKQQTRFDLYDTPKKNAPPVAPSAEAPAENIPVDPQQMSFTDQPADKDAKDGVKPS